MWTRYLGVAQLQRVAQLVQHSAQRGGKASAHCTFVFLLCIYQKYLHVYEKYLHIYAPAHRAAVPAVVHEEPRVHRRGVTQPGLGTGI